jgi:uncharacterized protein YbcI
MNKKTTAQLESELTDAMVALQKDYLGRPAVSARTYLLEDLILVRLENILTPAEQKLAGSREGRSLVKETRRRLFETTRPMIEEQVRHITGARLVSLHTDLSTSTAERVIVIVVHTCLTPASV